MSPEIGVPGMVEREDGSRESVDKDELIEALVAKLEELRSENEELRRELTLGSGQSSGVLESPNEGSAGQGAEEKQKLEYYQYEISRLNEQVSRSEWMVKALTDGRSSVEHFIEEGGRAFDEMSARVQHSYLNLLVGGVCALSGAFSVGFGALAPQLLPIGEELLPARSALVSFSLIFGVNLLVIALLVGLRSLLNRLGNPIFAEERKEQSPTADKLAKGGYFVILASLLMFSLAIVLLLFANRGAGLAMLLKFDLMAFGLYLASSNNSQWVNLSLFCSAVLLVAACGGATVRAHILYFESLKAYLRRIQNHDRLIKS